MDRLIRPSTPEASRYFLVIILCIGLLFVVLGFVSSTDYSPSPVHDTVLIAGGFLVFLTGALGLKSPTYSLSGRARLTPSRLYAQLGAALLGLGIGSTILLGPGWDTALWLLPGILALHRSWLYYRLTRFTQEKGLARPSDIPG